MKLGVYSVFDEVAKSYTAPAYFQNDEVAKRAYVQAFQDEKSQLCQYKNDCRVYRVATFDSETGVMETMDRSLIIQGTEVLLNGK